MFYNSVILDAVDIKQKQMLNLSNTTDKSNVEGITLIEWWL